MVLVIEVSTIIHDMPICLWRTMDLWIVGKHVQLDFLESPSRDGSSKEAIVDWKTTITEILDLYNRSPFGKRSGGSLIGLVDILVKLTGMNTDHCAKEKKDARE